MIGNRALAGGGGGRLGRGIDLVSSVRIDFKTS